MPTVSGSKSILAGTANYQATDWASAGGGGSLDLQAAAVLKRGIDLRLGAEALVSLDASMSRFLAADLKGQANAALRVRGQIQVPMDLFDEAGLAIRLQAVAEAAAGVELAIGLNVGDFLALAESDPKMKGVGMGLLRALLAEAKIQGGVRAKAAVAAMAYANIAVTGRLLPSPGGGGAGFTVAAEAGMGLKAGAGYRVFARLGIDEPGRLVRRCTDIVVDDVLGRIEDRLSNAAERGLLDELRAPAKIAIRTCYELGAELGRNPKFNASQAPVIAQRCVQVALEEAQRYLLARLTDVGFHLFESGLQSIGFNAGAWAAAQRERDALARRLRAIPDEPYDLSAANQSYWLGAADDAVALAIALGGRRDATAKWVEPVAMVWAATQLAFTAVQRISESNVRLTLMNATPDRAFEPFIGAAPQPAPQLLKEHISKTVRPGRPVQEPTLDDLLQYLLRQTVVDGLVQRFPAVLPVLDLAGRGTAPIDAMRTIMTNLGGFVAQPGGRVDPQRSLQTILEGLQNYVDVRLVRELEPALRSALADGDPELQYFVDEVLLASITFTTDTVFRQARSWTTGGQVDQDTLREACSAVVMNLVGRSLIVTTDVLLNRALEGMGDALRGAGAAINQRGGIVDKLARSAPSLNRRVIHDAVEEIFDIAADVFRPLPDDRRARIRELMYQVIDTAPSGGTDLQESLREDDFIPNKDAALALALELGGAISDNFIRLIERLIELVGEQILALLEAAVDAIEEQVRKWIEELRGLLDDAVKTLRDLEASVHEMQRRLDVATDRVLDGSERFLRVLGASNRRAPMRSRVATVVRDAGLAALSVVPAYSALPRAGKNMVATALEDAIQAGLDNRIVDDVEEALRRVDTRLDQFVADATNIDPNADLTTTLIDLLADRVEDAIDAVFGSRILFPIHFTVKGHFRGPTIRTPLGSFTPRVDIDLSFDLGEVRVGVRDVVRAIRQWVSDLEAVKDAARDLAKALADLLDLERLIDAQDLAAEDIRARRDQAERQIRETTETQPVAHVVHPGAAASYGGAVPVEIAFSGMPGQFLGGGEEMQRVHIFLNEGPLPLSRFNVAAGQRSDNGFPTLDRGMTFTRAVHPLISRKIDARSAPRAERLSVIQPAANPVQPPATKGGGQGRTSVLGGVKARVAARGGMTLGRVPRVSATDGTLADLQPEVILQSTLRPAELREGFNTLTVVIANGAKRSTVTESIVFHVSDMTTIDDRVTRIPSRFEIDPELLGPALREVAARGGARRGTGAAKAGTPAKATTSRFRAGSEVAAAGEALRQRVLDGHDAPIDAPIAAARAQRAAVKRHRGSLKRAHPKVGELS